MLRTKKPPATNRVPQKKGRLPRPTARTGSSLIKKFLESPESLTRPAAVKRVFFIFFRLFESFFSTVEHTTALAQKHLFLLKDLFLFRVHPMRSAPYSFITSVLPTKHLFGPLTSLDCVRRAFAFSQESEVAGKIGDAPSTGLFPKAFTTKSSARIQIDIHY
jgi:hypothetical protein